MKSIKQSWFILLKSQEAIDAFEKLPGGSVEGNTVKVICSDGVERSLCACTPQLLKSMDRLFKLNSLIRMKVFLSVDGKPPRLIAFVHFRREKSSPKTTDSRKKKSVFAVDPVLVRDRTDRRTNGFKNLVNTIRNVKAPPHLVK